MGSQRWDKFTASLSKAYAGGVNAEADDVNVFTERGCKLPTFARRCHPFASAGRVCHFGTLGTRAGGKALIFGHILDTS